MLFYSQFSRSTTDLELLPKMDIVVPSITKHPATLDPKQFASFICSEFAMQNVFMRMLSIQKPIVTDTKLKVLFDISFRGA